MIYIEKKILRLFRESYILCVCVYVTRHVMCQGMNNVVQLLI